MSIANSTLTTEATPVYTSSGSSATTAIYFHNTDGSAQTFNLYVVPNGETVANVHRIYGEKTVSSKDTYIIDMEKTTAIVYTLMPAPTAQLSQLSATQASKDIHGTLFKKHTT